MERLPTPEEMDPHKEIRDPVSIISGKPKSGKSWSKSKALKEKKKYRGRQVLVPRDGWGPKNVRKKSRAARHPWAHERDAGNKNRIISLELVNGKLPFTKEQGE